MNQDTNFSLVERARGNGPAIGRDELLDLLAELDAWRFNASLCDITAPENLKQVFDDLENRPLCIDEDHADYDDLKEFFDDCADIIGYCNPWQCTADNAKAMIEELHEMNRQLGGE